jgi:hypothetical protein
MRSTPEKTVNRQIIDRLTTICCTCLVMMPAMVLKASAQMAPEVAIDHIFRYESSSPGPRGQGELAMSLKKWLGAYQRLLKDGDNYTAVFDRASLPLTVESKENGDFKGFGIGCKSTSSLPMSEAPEEFRKLLLKCRSNRPNF